MSNEPWAVLYRNKNVVKHELHDNLPVELTEGLSILPRFVVHRRDFTDTLSFTIKTVNKSLFFCPDIDEWDGMVPDLVSITQTVDVALIDATFYDDFELPGRDMSSIPHPRVIQTVEILENQQRRAEVVLVHLNHSNKLWIDTETVSWLKKDKNITVGTKGMLWDL